MLLIFTYFCRWTHNHGATSIVQIPTYFPQIHLHWLTYHFPLTILEAYFNISSLLQGLSNGQGKVKQRVKRTENKRIVFKDAR